jgi:hypothetical protein
VIRRLGAALLCVLCIAAMSACGLNASQTTSCDLRDAPDLMLLVAQSVPSATRLPCVSTLPAGWHFDSSDIRSGYASFSLDNDVAGDVAVTDTLTRSCDTAGAVEVPTTAGEVGLHRFELPGQLSGGYRATRFYVFDGGCITYRFAFAPGAGGAFTAEADSALGFLTRAEVRRQLQENLGVELCGAGAPPCPGSTPAT